MIITDRIWDIHTVSDQLIIDLINTAQFQRLRGITQFGVPDEWYHLKSFSRYEHSIGVYLLLRTLWASREEQVAGLLHDISHTAFSHVIDWVVGSGKTEDYQDEHHEEIIKTPELSAILQKHGLDPSRIASLHSFHLLDRDYPDLCADRIDYAMREFPEEIVRQLQTCFLVTDTTICIRSMPEALLFARNFLIRQTKHWAGFEAASRYRLFANALRFALDHKILTPDDFYTKSEREIVDCVKASPQPAIQKTLQLLTHKSLEHAPKSKKFIHKKFRAVDPLVLTKNGLKRLSDIHSSWKEELENERKENEKGIQIAVI